MEVNNSLLFNKIYQKFLDLYTRNTHIFIISFVLLITLFFYKSIFFVAFFILLDLLKSYIKANFNIRIYVDILVLGIITLSYALSPIYGVIMSLFIVINRIFFGTIEKRHLIKTLILMGISYLTSYLSNINFVLVAMFVYLLRYGLEYLVDYFLRTLSFGRGAIRIFQTFTAFIFFKLIGIILVIFLRS